MATKEEHSKFRQDDADSAIKKQAEAAIQASEKALLGNGLSLANAFKDMSVNFRNPKAVTQAGMAMTAGLFKLAYEFGKYVSLPSGDEALEIARKEAQAAADKKAAANQNPGIISGNSNGSPTGNPTTGSGGLSTFMKVGRESVAAGPQMT